MHCLLTTHTSLGMSHTHSTSRQCCVARSQCLWLLLGTVAPVMMPKSGGFPVPVVFLEANNQNSKAAYFMTLRVNELSADQCQMLIQQRA